MKLPTIDWKYPWMFGADFKSCHKSIWLGWWLITWHMEYYEYSGQYAPTDLSISFQPSL